MTGRRILGLGLVALVGCAGDDSGRPTDDTALATAGTGGSGSDSGDDGVMTDDDADDDDPTTGDPTTSSADESTDDDADADADGDSTGTDDGTDTQGGTPGPWLLTIDNAAAPPNLVRIDTATGAGEAQCQLPAATYNSLVLTRDGTLLVHNATAGRIERYDPCDCGFQIVGPTSTGALQLGLGEGDTLLGLESTLDALYTVSPNTGLANAIGPLGFDFVGASLAYSDALPPSPMAVEDGTNQLFTLDPATGSATLAATLSQMVTNPGLAYRPDTDTMYLCDAGDLYELDPDNGMLTEIGSIGLTGACTSLASPRVAEACLD